MLFGAVEAVKRDLAEHKRQKVYADARNAIRFGCSKATDDDFRVVLQAVDQRVAGKVAHRYVLATPTSQVGKSLAHQGLVEYNKGWNQLLLTPMGEKLCDYLQLHLRGVGGPTKKTALAKVGGNDPVQKFIKDLRATWDGRPRFSRFTIRSWMYRLRIWWEGTVPETQLIDWSKFHFEEWGDEDEAAYRRQWYESNMLAVWFCPDGVDAGIEAHDKFLALCEERGLIGPQPKLLSELTGYIPPLNPAPPVVEMTPVKKEQKEDLIWISTEYTASTSTKWLKVYNATNLFISPAKFKRQQEATAHMKRLHEEAERRTQLEYEIQAELDRAQKEAETAKKITKGIEKLIPPSERLSEEQRKVQYEIEKAKVAPKAVATADKRKSLPIGGGKVYYFEDGFNDFPGRKNG